jgi:RNA polymerase sigma-70 factor (ECF subfamily)
MVAILTRLFGLHNLELAEDVLQDTLHEALRTWGTNGIPDNPEGWLMTVAKRKAINTIKRERFYRSFAGDMDTLLKSEWTASYTMDQVFLEDEIRDSQLRMIFTCCHSGAACGGTGRIDAQNPLRIRHDGDQRGPPHHRSQCSKTDLPRQRKDPE